MTVFVTTTLCALALTSTLATIGKRDGETGGLGKISRYTVTRKGAPPITGKLVLGVVRRDGKVAIRLIATEPRP